MSRNLLKYPIDLEEVLETIQRASDRAFDPRCYGGNESYIMNRVHEVIRRHFRHEDFNPSKGN